MSLLPKSNDWCRRYSSKFNSGWDIPPGAGGGAAGPTERVNDIETPACCI